MADADIKSNLSVGTTNAPTQTSPGYFAGSGQSPTDVVRYKMKETTLIERMQYPLDRPKYYINIDVFNYHRFNHTGADMFAVSRLDQIGTVTLPLPANLTDGHGVSYSTPALNMATGNALQLAGPAIDGVVRDVQNGNADILQSATKNVERQIKEGKGAGNLAGVATGILFGMADKKTGGAATGLATAVAGVAGFAPNQFLTVLLTGPQYKRYQFDWIFSPRNDVESDVLREILMKINNWMAPGTLANGALFTFPQVFRLKLMPNSKYMYKFKPAVIENITVDYTGGGMPSFFRKSRHDGLNAPTTLRVRMHFLELEFWLRDQYNDSNDPTNTGANPATGQRPPEINGDAGNLSY